jgi:hypothetical protein
MKSRQEKCTSLKPKVSRRIGEGEHDDEIEPERRVGYPLRWMQSERMYRELWKKRSHMARMAGIVFPQ